MVFLNEGNTEMLMFEMLPHQFYKSPWHHPLTNQAELEADMQLGCLGGSLAVKHVTIYGKPTNLELDVCLCPTEVCLSELN